MKSDVLTPEMQRRLLLLARYMQACSAGDLVTMGTIMAAAEYDATLERMLIEASSLEQDQQLPEALRNAQDERDRLFVSGLLTYLETSAGPNWTSNPVSLPQRPRARRRRRMSGLVVSLAAALLGMLLLGGFLTVLTFSYPKTTGYPGTAKAPTSTAYATPQSSWHVVPIPTLPHALFLGGVAAISASDAWAISTESEEGKLIHWDGQHWSVVPGASLNGDPVTYTGIAAVAANDVWIVGFYFTNNGPGKGVKILAEHWDGQHWSLTDNGDLPVLGQLNAITAVSSTDVWAVGDAISVGNDTPTSLFLHWDGQRWHTISHPLMETTSPGYTYEAEFSALTATSAHDIWAVGNVSIYHPNPAGANQFKPAIEHWNGQQWKVVASPDLGRNFDLLNSVTATSANEAWAVGSSSNSLNGNIGQSFIDHWNGQKWSLVQQSLMPQKATLNGIVAVSPNDVWAVGAVSIAQKAATPTVLPNGSFTFAPQFAGLLQHWNGQKWSSTTFRPSVSTGFSCLALIPGTQKIWVIGYGSSMYGSQ